MKPRDDDQKFGDWLRQARRELGDMPLRELSLRSGVSPATLSSLERSDELLPGRPSTRGKVEQAVQRLSLSRGGGPDRRAPLHVVVPTYGDGPVLQRLLGQLRAQLRRGDTVCVIDTWAQPAGQPGHLSADGWPAGWQLLRDTDHPLHITAWWNQGWGQGDDEAHTLFLNNDVTLGVDTVERMRDLLDREPSVWLVGADSTVPPSPLPAYGLQPVDVTGTKRAGGWDGSCFMVRAEVCQTFDSSDPRNPGDPADDKHAPTDRLFPTGLLFDEQFRWWCSDDDLADRIHRSGGRQVVLRGLGIDHLNEATARQFSELHRIKAEDVERYRAKWPGRW